MENLWGIPLLLVYAGLFCWIIWKWNHFKSDSFSGKWMILFFLIKFFSGILLTLIYTYYYNIRNEADIYKYFDDSYYITQALWEKPTDFFKMIFGIGNDTEYFTNEYYSNMSNWFRKYETQVYNDNHTVIRMNAVMRVFSFGYFHIHTLFFCFLSFIGMVSLYNGLKLFLSKEKHRLFGLFIFLFPSLTFWSSGALKESVMFFAVGNIFYLFCLLVQKRHSMVYVILGAFSFFIMLYLKSYALYAITVGIMMLIAGYIFRNRNLGWVYLATILLGITLLILFLDLNSHYNIPALVHQKHTDFYKHSLAMNAGSTFNTGNFAPTWGGIFRLAPEAIFTTIFRPLPMENLGIFGILSSIESVFIMVIMFFSLYRFHLPKGEQFNMVLCCFIIVLILGILIGISTTNFGSLVRYKIIVLPFLFFILVSITDFARISTRLVKN